VHRARRVVLLAVLAGVPLACGSASAGGGRATTGRPAAAGGATVLVLTQAAGFHHGSIPAAMALVRRLDAADPRWHAVFLPGARELTPARLSRARAVVFLLTSGELPLDAAGKSALVRFVRRGGALVGAHSAADTFHRWPGWEGLLGAEFVRHKPAGPGRVIVEDRAFPATRGLPRSFATVDEYYQFDRDPRCCAHVLVRQDTGAHGPDRPLVWCRLDGRGRVFYDGLGHLPAFWGDPRQATLIRGGLRWALGLAAGRCPTPRV